MQRLGMGQAAAGHPELLIESDGIHDQGVSLPLSDRRAVIARHSFRSGNDRTPIRIDDAPIAISAPEQDQDPAQLRLLNELKPVWHLKLTWSARRETPPDRIVFQK